MLAALAVLIGAGTIGFHLIEKIDLFRALYMTVITISTVGYGDITPKTPGGRLFTIGIIVTGAILVASFVGTGVQALVDGEWREHLSRIWRKRMLDKLNQHVIVCGYGRVGRHTVQELERERIPYVVVDMNADRIAELRDQDRVAVVGDATEEALLKEVGIDRARALISALSQDALNVFTVLTARSLNPNVMIIARTNSEESEPKLLKAGANRVITPYKISAHRMVTMLARPDVGEFLEGVMQMGDVELLLEQVSIPDASPLEGKTLAQAEIRARTGVTILACTSGGRMVHAPGANQRLVAGTRMIALGTRDQLNAFDKLALG